MNNKKNFRTIIIFLLIAVSITACSASSPASVAKKAISASLHGDCDEVPQYLTSKAITTSGGEADVISQCQDLYDKQTQSGTIKVIETVTEDDGAMVILKISWEEGQTSTMTVMLEKEDNQWKIWNIF